MVLHSSVPSAAMPCLQLVGGWVQYVCMCVRCSVCVRYLCLYTAEYVLLLTLMSIRTTGNMRMYFPTRHLREMQICDFD